MRRLYGFCFLFFTFNGFAQFDFVDENNLWVHEGGSFDGFGYDEIIQYHYFTEDTVINGINYKKLITWHMVFEGSSDVIDVEQVIYQGAFREENDTVFYVPVWDLNEIIYVDFSVEVGDTMAYLSYDDMVVESIEFIEISGQTVKQFNTNRGIVIEGIGGEYGIFKLFALFIEGSDYLTCFTRDEISNSVGPFSDSFECISELPELNPGDINGDGVINTADLLELLNLFGESCIGTECAGDINGDGQITSSDLTDLFSLFGTIYG